jgi:hypothetical protein
MTESGRIKMPQMAIWVFFISLVITGGCSSGNQENHETKSGQKDMAVSKAQPGLSAEVSAPEGIKLFAEPRISNNEIETLPINTVLWVLEEVQDSGQGHWYRLKTRSGLEGWSQGPINLCSVQKTQQLISSDRETFEKKLRDLILDAAAKQISQENPHSPMYIVSKEITSPLTPEGGNSYSVTVSCSMAGRFQGRNRSRLDVKVDLFVDLNKDLLSASAARVKNVAIIGNQGSEEAPAEAKISLLKYL